MLKHAFLAAAYVSITFHPLNVLLISAFPQIFKPESFVSTKFQEYYLMLLIGLIYRVKIWKVWIGLIVAAVITRILDAIFAAVLA